MPFYQPSNYSLDIFNRPDLGIIAPRTKPRWYEMSGMERERSLGEMRRELERLPEPPEKKGRLKEAFKPVLNVLQVVGGILNVPSASISGAVKQLVDGQPGFDAQEFYRDVFGFRDQVSWRDVIGLLAERDEDKNVFDKKWAQISAGLLLDIALDPLTWFGFGAVKNISAETAKTAAQGAKKALYKQAIDASDDLIEGASKILTSKGYNQANRTFRNIVNRSRGFGFQTPWSPRRIVGQPLVQTPSGREIRGILRNITDVTPPSIMASSREAVLQGQTYLQSQIPRLLELSQKATPVEWVGDVLRKYVPGFEAVEEAFNPYKKADLEAIEAKLKYLQDSGQDVRELQQTLVRMVASNNKRGLRAAAEAMVTAPYFDDEIVRQTFEKSALHSRLIRMYAKGDKSWQVYADRLAKKFGETRDIFDKRLRDLLNDVEAHNKLAEFSPAIFKTKSKPTAREMMTTISDIYDDIAAKQLQRGMEAAGLKTGDLASLAEFKPVRDFETFFKNYTEKFTDDQKNAIRDLVEGARFMMDDWDIAENTIGGGLAHMYVRDYLPQFTGARKLSGAPRELGGRARFAMKRYTDVTMVQKFDQAKNVLIQRGVARNANHAEKLLKSGQMEEFGTLVDTVSEMLYIRGSAHIKAVHKYHFLEELKSIGTKIDKNIPAPTGFSRVKGTDNQVIEQLADYVFDINTSDYVNRMMSVVANDKAIKWFLKKIDDTQNWWKVLVTTVNPGFHFRNFYSNHFIGYVKHGLGYFNPELHLDALAMSMERVAPDNKLLWALMPVSKSRLKKVRNGKTLKAWIDGLRPYGVARTGVRMAEREALGGVQSATKVRRILENANIAGKKSVFAKVGDALGGVIESEARVASFLLDFDTLGDMQLAARATQEAFVDYANLTDFEREIARRVIPFWSWMKQNTVNQVKFIFTQPGRYSKIPRIAQALEAGAPEHIPLEERPEYFRELWMWQLPMQLPDGTALFMNPNFPFQDLNRLNPFDENGVPGGGWKDTIVGAMTPLIKVPIELATGYDFFRKQRIEKWEGYKAPIPGILQTAADALSPDLRNKLGIETNNRGQHVMDPYVAHAIQQMLPFVRNTAKLLMQEPTAIPADKYFQFLSYTLGIKIKPVDRLTQQYYMTRDKLEERKRKLREAGIEY